ncbi:hypothetical protein GQ42DRAFT_127802 [Ramicandelaber brevisporus]|nr:hypothetical protein GQ42DRAFT_127802 [Ramicandelaber brevisporus]
MAQDKNFSARGNEDDDDDVEEEPKSAKIVRIIAGVICILLGLMFTFLGNRVFRFVMFLSGFFLMTFLIMYLCMVIKRPEANDRTRYLVYFGISLGLGFLLGFLFACVWFLGFAAVGALAGLSFALFLIGLKDGGLITSKGGRAGLIAGLILVFILLIFFLEKHAVILSTAGTGAWTLFNGIDMFAQTGFKDIVANVARPDGAVYHTNGKVYGMVAGTVVVFIIGAVVQYKYYSGPIGIQRIRERKRQAAIEAQMKQHMIENEMGERNV